MTAMNKKEITPLKFYGIHMRIYLIIYAVLLGVSIMICGFGESDLGAVFALFLFVFLILFAVCGVAAAVLSAICTFVISKLFKEKKNMIPTVIFTLLSAAYFISLGISIQSMLDLNFSIPG